MRVKDLTLDYYFWVEKKPTVLFNLELLYLTDFVICMLMPYAFRTVLGTCYLDQSWRRRFDFPINIVHVYS